MFSLDITAVVALNTVVAANSVLATCTSFLATYLQYIVFGALAVFLFEERRVVWVRVRLVTVLLVLALLVRLIIKPWIAYLLPLARPYVALQEITLLAPREVWEEWQSFPSGHALFFFALATAMWMHNKRAGVLLYIAALGIVVGRVAAGLHYPTDVIAGAVLGGGVAYGVVALVHRYASKEWLSLVHSTRV